MQPVSPQYVELYLSQLSKLVIARRDGPCGPVSRETVRQQPRPDLKPVVAPELPRMVQRVRCVRCGCSLTRDDDDSRLRLKRLPGRDWLELVDCWSCHRSEFAPLTTRLSYSQDGNTILPSPGSLLVGGMFLLADLQQDFSSLRDTDGRCPGCQCRVGEEVWQQGAATTAATHIRLSRCEVQLESSEREKPLIWPFAALAMEELGELIDSQGALSFTICSAASPSQPAIQLRLLSWSAHIRSSPTGAFRPAFILEVRSAEMVRDEPDQYHLGWSHELLEQLEESLEQGRLMASLLGYPPTYSVLFSECQ